MNSTRRFQNIKVPKHLRPTPGGIYPRTSVSRTVREIRPCADPNFSEVGKAVVFEREVIVATKNGQYWVIIEAQASTSATEAR